MNYFVYATQGAVLLVCVCAQIWWACGQVLMFSCLYVGQQVMYASFDIARQLELLLLYMAHCSGHMVLWDDFVPT